MALKHATAPKVVETPDPVINVAPEVEENEESTSNGTTRERSPWTAEKIRIVKAAVRSAPGITFDALLTSLRAGELADHLSGASGRQRLLNLLANIRRAEEKTEATNAAYVASGEMDKVVEFTPLPEVVMPEKIGRPNLLAD